MTDCIKSPFALNRADGYGAVYYEGKHMNHSRVVYLQHTGKTSADIEGLIVRHSCDNPSCINPQHLILGTHADNMQDKVARGRWKGGRPGKLTAEQVAVVRLGGSSTTLAAQFNVSRGTIDNVINHKGRYK